MKYKGVKEKSHRPSQQTRVKFVPGGYVTQRVMLTTYSQFYCDTYYKSLCIDIGNDYIY